MSAAAIAGVILSASLAAAQATSSTEPPWERDSIASTATRAVVSGEARGVANASGGIDYEALMQRVVKVHGGALGREQGYASGVIVSSDGRIVTALSAALESPALRVVLADGRRFSARVERRDERRQLALLRIDATDLPCFSVDDAPAPQPGEWVIAAGNPFKVATGPEPVSIMLGVLSGRTRLAARRRAQEFSYDGDVLLLDMVVATPGFAGGALVDLDGRLLGMIGKAVKSTRTNTWLNYAMPASELAAFLKGEEPASNLADRRVEEAHAFGGIRLFDVGGRVRLAYVERVRPGSAAQRAGVRAGDLILAVGDTAVASCEDFYAACAALTPGEPVNLLIKRGGDVIDRTIQWEERSQ